MSQYIENSRILEVLFLNFDKILQIFCFYLNFSKKQTKVYVFEFRHVEKLVSIKVKLLVNCTQS